MPCHSHSVLRQLHRLCSARLAGLAFRSQHLLPEHPAARRPFPVAPSKYRPPVNSRSTHSQAAASRAEQQATLVRPATGVPPDRQATAPALADLEQQLGPFSSAPSVPPPPPLVIIISGPSGVGKDAVISRLRERRPDIHFVVTATSRYEHRDGVR